MAIIILDQLMYSRYRQYAVSFTNNPVREVGGSTLSPAYCYTGKSVMQSGEIKKAWYDTRGYGSPGWDSYCWDQGLLFVGC